MTRRKVKEQMETGKKGPVERSTETHSGTPNAIDPNEVRDNEHQSGYGGDGGRPRSSSDETQNLDE